MIFNIVDREINSAQFGVTFFTSSQRHDTCGTNGLPLTPNSIRILGRSQYLKSLNHPNLSQYVDIIRGKHERIIVVLEFYTQNLKTLLKTFKGKEQHELILEIGSQVLNGLKFLNKHGIVCRNLCLENLLLDGSGETKIFNFGLYYMTNNGKFVSFPIGNPKYTAPEVFLSGVRKGPSVYSCDVWSLGIILVELVIGEEIWSELKLSQVLRKVASLTHCEGSVFQRLLQEHHYPHIYTELNPKLRDLIERCLDINPVTRGSPSLLLKDLFNKSTKASDTVCINPFAYPEVSVLNNIILSSQLQASVPANLFNHSDTETPVDQKAKASVDHLLKRSFKEIYYLWQLAGGDVFAELRRQGLTRKKPAVLSLPCSMTLEGESAGKISDIKHLHLPDVITQAAQLPLIIREKDIEYQFHRILLFDRLIKGYPYTKSLIHRESLKDIPPYFRAQIWSCLLEISGDPKSIYNSIDKETPTSTDRQIEVDIPRCHQYDELLSSPIGHEKFKRVLKAWVVSNTEYVYWQGLDSLCAPFLYLNFNNEELAFSCLSAFIPKYLYNFFLKDNSVIIQEYLAKFSQLIAFHDPQLTNHLDSIGFIPELYAIPWFLTMFSHVFPLHKIFHLWDKLLLGDSSFSLCIGLAILYQLRESLLCSGFNECILLFSDMPEISIERCVKDSVDIYCSTPRSTLCRKHEPPPKQRKEVHRKISTDSDFSSNSLPNETRNSTSDGLKMEAIPLADLKKEKCPRISGEDFLALLDLNKTRFNKPKMVVVDVRNYEDYNRGAIPTSINMPYVSSFSADGSLIPTTEVNILNSNRGKIIAVVGNRGDSAVKFAEALLFLEFPRICVLHRGIDIFRSGNILVVPSSMNNL
ncbi:unnamed protein product [Allacma fusca]|uniref:TBC domain-containing protein kinase-like protein n=1 Tax=Allacma fusca TaxID=39272 RepID=A0A8J2PRX4_9HEXA|nr:unnamed protein product [Allacma fusca]